MNNIQLAKKFCNGEYVTDLDGEIWTDTFNHIINNLRELEFNKEKIHTLWTSYGGHLRRKVKDDDLLLSVLKASLPGYNGKGLTLYRGECQFLYKDKKIGFCWSPIKKVAAKYASRLNSIESGGVLLEAFAPSSAILASPNEHSTNQLNEFEYTCNPLLLENIKVLAVYEKSE